ncbi:MAG: CRISPR-associated RAMP protein Csx7 [Candidatus Nezhaarchaeales archaeon]
MKTFDECFVSYTIRAVLTNETPLSIGSGKGLPIGGIDNPIVRLGDKPIIPGSSIKGVLRSEAERYAKLRGWPVCDVVSHPTFEIEEKRKRRENYRPCIVCRVFGGPTIASHIVFLNATPRSYRIETRTRVSICRLTGASYPGKLFDIEYITPGSEFDWNMIIEGYDLVNESSDEVELINYLIKKFVNRGFYIGRGRSYGHGLVRMKVEKVEREELKDGRLIVEDYTEKYLKVLELK